MSPVPFKSSKKNTPHMSSHLTARRWRRRGKITAAFLAMAMGVNYHTPVGQARFYAMKPSTTSEKMEKAKPVEKPVTRTTPAKQLRKEIPIPIELPVFSSIPKTGSWCARYVRLYAEKMYQVKYNSGNAWDLAAKNKSVWKIGTIDRYAGNPNRDYLNHVKQGYILGIYYPSSGSNKPNRPYTHVVTYDGMRNGKAVVTNHIAGRTTRENLDDLLKRLSHKSKRNPDGKKAAVMEVIGPRTE